MPNLRVNKNTSLSSWGFDDGKLFYPFGSSEIAKAMASFVEMTYKTSGKIDEEASGEPLSDWKLVE